MDRNGVVEDALDDATILEKIETIPGRLQYFAKTHPDRELFVFCTKTSRDVYTASRLLDLAGKFAGHLVEQGFQRGDFLANSVPNSPERLITDLGATMAGCATFNVPMLYADGADLYHMARRAQCKGVIVLPSDKSAVWNLLKTSITDHTATYSPVSCDQIPCLTTAVLVRTNQREGAFLDTLVKSTVTCPEVDLQCYDIAAIFHTTGSTGLPKLIAKTHRDLLNRIARSAPFSNNFSSNRSVIYFNDRILGWLGGYPFTTYAFGDTHVMPNLVAEETGLDPGELYQLFVREKCNISFMFSDSLHSVCQYVTEKGLTEKIFRLLLTGGYPIRQTQIKKATNLAETVVIAYGCSEIGFVAQLKYKEELGDYVDCNCGKACEYFNDEFRVEDSDGSECKPGVVGHVLLKGHEMFSGYLNREESPDPDTVKTIRPDGWIDLGDYGYMSEDGDLFVMGRGKDCINIEGVMFYPSRLEAKLVTYPGVIDAIAVPVSDDEKSQVICACLNVYDNTVLNTSKLTEFCTSLYQQGTNTLSLPVPAFYMIFKDRDFPKTLTGKPDRSRLKNMAEETYGSGTQ